MYTTLERTLAWAAVITAGCAWFAIAAHWPWVGGNTAAVFVGLALADLMMNGRDAEFAGLNIIIAAIGVVGSSLGAVITD